MATVPLPPPPTTEPKFGYSWVQWLFNLYRKVIQVADSSIIPSYLSGLTLSNSSDADHDIDIASGTATNAGGDVYLTNAATLTKQIDVDWASGSAAGGFPSALTLTADTTYHVFLIGDATGTLVDAGFDTSLVAANLLADASGYSVYRRVGSVITDATSNIYPFVQTGNEFIYTTPRNIRNATAGVTTRVTETAHTPTGIVTTALLLTHLGSSGTGYLTVRSLDSVDTAASATNFDHFVGASGTYNQHRNAVATNTSSQFAWRCSSTAPTVIIDTHGWIDHLSSTVLSTNTNNGADLFVNGTKVDSTSGSSIDFDIPSGVKTVYINYAGVSSSAAGEWYVQLGDSGGVETTGYLGGSTRASASVVSQNYTTAFGLNVDDANTVAHGSVALRLLDAAANTWVCQGSLAASNASTTYTIQGSKSLSGELTTVRLTFSTGNFDAGAINIQYDNPDERTVVTNTANITQNFGNGIVAQVVNTQDGEVATGTTTIPLDDTIPQNTEGDEYMTLAITPTNSSSKLKIDVVCTIGNSTSGRWLIAALFQDSTASALAVNFAYGLSGTETQVVSFTHWMTAGTTSSTTFKVRGGANGSGTTTFNGSAGSRYMGGALASSITITEYLSA